VLVAEEITRHQVTINTPVRTWLRNNIKMLVQTYRMQVGDCGFWVVTKTYTTRRCAIAVMTVKSTSVEITVSTNVKGLLVLDPGVIWRSAGSGTSTDVHVGKEGGDEGGDWGGDEDGDDVVVFMSGVQIWPHPVYMYSTKEVTKQKNQKPFVRGSEGVDSPRTTLLEVEVKGRESEVWGIETLG